MIYLDACLVIYLVENHSVFAPRIKQHLSQAASAEFAISPLVKAEVLVMPFRQLVSRNSDSVLRRMWRITLSLICPTQPFIIAT
jgi:hypothetical protein